MPKCDLELGDPIKMLTFGANFWYFGAYFYVFEIIFLLVLSYVKHVDCRRVFRNRTFYSFW